MVHKKIGEMLLEFCFISKEQLQQALHIQAQDGGKLGDILIDQGYISEDDFLNFLFEQLNIKGVDLKDEVIDHDLAKQLIPGKLAEKHQAFIISDNLESCRVVMADPLDEEAIAELQQVIGADRQLEICVANRTEIREGLKEIYD